MPPRRSLRTTRRRADRPGVRAAALLAGILLAAAAAGTPPAERDALLRTLREAQRPAGGWTYPPGTLPFTSLVRTAERVARWFGGGDWDVVVMRSPGTPAGGLELLASVPRDPAALAAARRAGDLLVATQRSSGGWFSEMPVYGRRTPWWFDLTAVRTTLDDDVTTGSIRLLLGLADATHDTTYRATAERGLDLLLRAQLPGGGWPITWRPAWLRRARPHVEDLPSLNDGATPLAIATLCEAAQALARPDLLAAARRGGDWLLGVQHPPPRAGWAQQYAADGTPSGGRAFEPPALATWETRHAVEALLALARATGERRWCEAARRAADWLAAAAVGPSCWPRFVEWDDGTPIWLDRHGRRVPDARQAARGYDMRGEYGIPALLGRLGYSGWAPAAPPLPGDAGRCGARPSPPPHTARELIAAAARARPVPSAVLGPCADAW